MDLIRLTPNGLVALAGSLIFVSTSWSTSATKVFDVDSETAALEIVRIDHSTAGKSGPSVPILTRRFNRQSNERGLFGPGWCSEVDLRIVGADLSDPKILELRDCAKISKRVFHSLLDTWIETGSQARILKRQDGRWELTEAPFPIFRADGRLDSFVAGDAARWFVRRDSQGLETSIDSLRARPVKFKRSALGDLEALVDTTGREYVKYTIHTLLEKVEKPSNHEIYEYGPDGTLDRLTRVAAGQASQVWKFSFNDRDRVSTVIGPEGCTSRWVFDQSKKASLTNDLLAREVRECPKANPLEAPKPVVAAPALVREVAGASRKTSVRQGAVLLTKEGAGGAGRDSALVETDKMGLPIRLQITRFDGKKDRLEIFRDLSSGAVLALRSPVATVQFRRRSASYESKQLELIQDYESWMAQWSRH